MIIHKFNVIRIFAFKPETEPPLHVHPNAVLAFSVTLQRFEVI